MDRCINLLSLLTDTQTSILGNVGGISDYWYWKNPS